MNGNKYFFESIQGLALLAVYFFAIVMLFLVGWYGLRLIFPLPGIHLALYVILFILISALLGAWLWVLIRLPRGLSGGFDPIKNRIAARDLTTVQEFSKEVARFLVDYFGFFSFDVNCAVIGIRDHEPVRYPDEKFLPQFDHRMLLTKSRNTEEVVSLGKLNCAGQSYHAYLVPVWFGKEWLGYFCVFTDSRLLKIFQNLLKTFEEEYLDDQLMHVLNFENSIK